MATDLAQFVFEATKAVTAPETKAEEFRAQEDFKPM